MSVLLPNEQNWLVSNWVSRGFFEDALPYLDQFPSLKNTIQYCVDTEVDTLDLRTSDQDTIREFKGLVNRIVELYKSGHTKSFYEPEYIPIYIDKLHELSDLINRF